MSQAPPVTNSKKGALVSWGFTTAACFPAVLHPWWRILILLLHTFLGYEVLSEENLAYLCHHCHLALKATVINSIADRFAAVISRLRHTATKNKGNLEKQLKQTYVDRFITIFAHNSSTSLMQTERQQVNKSHHDRKELDVFFWAKHEYSNSHYIIIVLNKYKTLVIQKLINYQKYCFEYIQNVLIIRLQLARYGCLRTAQHVSGERLRPHIWTGSGLIKVQ